MKGQAQTHFQILAMARQKQLRGNYWMCAASQTYLVFGFGSDGASVMTGCPGGVAVHLRGQNHEMVSIHCGAHRLALASSQAAHAIPYLKKFDNHLNTF